MSDLPVACTLSPAALKGRREGLLSALRQRALSHEELPHGLRLQFAATDDSAFAGRAYAAYGGIYIAASLLWLSIVERQRPTVTDQSGRLAVRRAARGRASG